MSDLILEGSRDADVLLGGAGNDTLHGGKGSDHLDGGDGFDTAVFDATFDSYIVSFDAASGQFSVVDRTSGSSVDTLVGVEQLRFRDAVLSAEEALTLAPTRIAAEGDGLVIVGNRLGVAILAGNGNDSVEGREGDDSLYGGKGSDTAVYRGNAADYTVSVDPATGETLVTDTVPGRDGSDRLSTIEWLRFADQRIEVPAAPVVNAAIPPPDSTGGSNGTDNLPLFGVEPPGIDVILTDLTLSDPMVSDVYVYATSITGYENSVADWIEPVASFAAEVVLTGGSYNSHGYCCLC